jgi:Protein of unknown function (DUF3052)
MEENPSRATQVPSPLMEGSYVSATADHADPAQVLPDSASAESVDTQAAARLGFTAGQVVQEIGYDEDSDEALRDAIESLTGSELVDEEYEDVVDAVLLWYREDDGDLVDVLMDALTALADGGHIGLLTPKAGRPGHIEPSDIGEAAPTAGLSQTSSVSAGRDWAGTRLVAPRARAGKR